MKMFLVKFLLSVVMMFAFSACDSALVSEVKEAEYSNGVSVAELFEDSGFCDSVDWSEVEFKNKQKYVKMECAIEEDSKVFENYDVLIYHFTSKNDTVDIYNSYYENDQGKMVSGIMPQWQANLLLEGLMQRALQ